MLAEVGAPPTGVTVEIRGQVTPLNEIFQGLSFGLIVAVVAILFLLTAYFQSWQLALVALSAVPAVLVGVLLCLLLTGSTLNLQSFMGAIMAVGVAVANAILLITFAEDARRQPSEGDAVEHTGQSARTAVQKRLRPILMTSLAMCAGMLPMALGWGEGGTMAAPLARADLWGVSLTSPLASGCGLSLLSLCGSKADGIAHPFRSTPTTQPVTIITHSLRVHHETLALTPAHCRNRLPASEAGCRDHRGPCNRHHPP